MSAHKVVVYYKPGCPFGIKLRVGLRLARVPFSSVRFRDDEEGATQVRQVNGGNEISPTVRIGHMHLTNPSVTDVRSALSGRS